MTKGRPHPIPARPRTLFAALLLAPLAAAAPQAQAQSAWKPAERIEHYTVKGLTGAELYAAIGTRGPKLGLSRVIAHTTFKLTWTRRYEPRGDACVISVARPKLTLIYTLPKVSGKLPAPLAKSWARFAEGVAAHERVHGDFITQMVRDIEAFSLGLRVENDPDCKKIRPILQQRLGELSDRQRQQGRDFDIVEMGGGGTVQQLILALVTGP